MKDTRTFQTITLDDIMNKLKELLTDNYDLVVAIARGGVLPGYLASRLLDIPLEILQISFRDDTHAPLYTSPRILSTVDFEYKNKRILLTDDVSNSGKTMETAIQMLPDSLITTLCISGNADISLFGVHDRCIKWPWMN